MSKQIRPRQGMDGLTWLLIVVIILGGFFYGVGSKLDDRHIASLIHYIGIAFILFAMVIGFTLALALFARLRSGNLGDNGYDGFENGPYPRRSRTPVSERKALSGPGLPPDTWSEPIELDEGSWVEVPQGQEQGFNQGEWS